MRWLKRSAKTRRSYNKSLSASKKSQSSNENITQQSSVEIPPVLTPPVHYGLLHGNSQTPGPSGVVTSRPARSIAYTSDSDSDSCHTVVSPDKRPIFHDSDSSQEQPLIPRSLSSLSTQPDPAIYDIATQRSISSLSTQPDPAIYNADTQHSISSMPTQPDPNLYGLEDDSWDASDYYNVPRVPDPLVKSAQSLYSGEWVNIGKSFDRTMSLIMWQSCVRCDQRFPDLSLRGGICRLCTNRRTHDLFIGNNMDPGIIPDALQDLSPVEEMLIARIHPVVCYYRIRGQQIGYSGHVIHFKQDVVQLHSKLPVNPSSSQLFVIITRSTPNGVANLRVRSSRVRNALEWLKQNHTYYHDIEIDEELLASLPIDDDITLPHLESNDEDIHDGAPPYILTESNFPNIPQLDQAEAIRTNLSVNVEWPSISNAPLSEFTTEGYLTQAFPTLFPFGRAGLRQPRLKKLSHVDYFQYLMRYSDQRFARNPRFRFVAFDSMMRWNAISQGNILIQKTALRDVTIDNLAERLRNHPHLASKVMFHVGKLRASQSFWSQRCGELLDMVQQIGTPTIFFTLSAADYHWPDLFRLLSPDTNPNDINDSMRSRLMHENPMVTAWFFRRRAETFIDKVLRKIYPIKDYWYRYEWQWRGSPHIHGVLWLEDAPDISALDEMDEAQRNDIADWFGNFCSAWNPLQQMPVVEVPSRYTFSEKLNDEYDLTNLLNSFQRHTKCGRHCIRPDKRTKHLRCRYGFPKDKQDRNMLLKENDKWVFKPRRNDEHLARYNKFITQVWRGNTDFSPITSKEAVLNYIARYASKCEHASAVQKKTLEDLIRDAPGSEQAKKLISKLLISSTAERDFSSQEIVHIMMSWPLYHSSRSFVNLCINDAAWVRISGTTEDSAIIHRYKQRPDELRHICLYDFAASVRYERGQFINRTKRAVVRIFPRLKLGSTDLENENYYKLMATAFIPWCENPESLIRDRRSANPWQIVCRDLPRNHIIGVDFPLPEDIFEEDVPADPVRVMRNVDMAISRAVPEIRQIDQLGRRQIDEAYEWGNHCVTSTEADRLRHWMVRAKEGFRQRVSHARNNMNFSPDQQRVIDICNEQINLILLNEYVPSKRIMVQGKAGSGKSFLISEIASRFRSHFGQDSVELLAPTGVAAVNIAGKTLHSFLQISAGSYTQLSDERLRLFQLKFAKLKVIIFDEMSMIGLGLLANIAKRLQEGTGLEEPFGGLIIYFFGDMQQLPPVVDNPWYSESTAALRSYGKFISTTIQEYFQLTTSHRQSRADQAQFRTLLDSIAVGTVSSEQYELLMSRRSSILPHNEKESFNGAVRLFCLREQVKEYNENLLFECGKPIAIIPAVHNVPYAEDATDEITHGLPATLHLCLDCRVMLRINIWTEAGLVNGSIGYVRDIIYAEGQRPPAQPIAVMVEFDNYTGPTYRDRLVPIVPIRKHWKSKGNSFWRSQFPINLAHAMTIHKSQGLTLDKAVVDIRETERQLGITYVAFSRVKTIQGIAIERTFAKDRLDLIAAHSWMNMRQNFLQKFN